MNGFFGIALAGRLDVKESFRARWFHLYGVVFIGLMVLFAWTGIADSRVLGFTGLSRMLVTYIQVTMAALPLFVLVTTARSLVGDREAGNLEYLLALPVGLAGWYWGKFAGRLAVVSLPVLVALGLGAVYGLARGHDVPWAQFALYAGLVVALSVCFLGLGFFLSSLARSTELALGSTLLVWLALVALLDLLLISLLIRTGMNETLVVAIALANPLQAFRTASMLLFDPQLVLLGPAAYVILDHFGRTGYVIWALAYPAALGLALAGLGYWRFRSTDLV